MDWLMAIHQQSILIGNGTSWFLILHTTILKKISNRLSQRSLCSDAVAIKLHAHCTFIHLQPHFRCAIVLSLRTFANDNIVNGFASLCIVVHTCEYCHSILRQQLRRRHWRLQLSTRLPFNTIKLCFVYQTTFNKVNAERIGVFVLVCRKV